MSPPHLGDSSPSTTISSPLISPPQAAPSPSAVGHAPSANDPSPWAIVPPLQVLLSPHQPMATPLCRRPLPRQGCPLPLALCPPLCQMEGDDGSRLPRDRALFLGRSAAAAPSGPSAAGTFAFSLRDAAKFLFQSVSRRQTHEEETVCVRVCL